MAEYVIVHKPSNTVWTHGIYPSIDSALEQFEWGGDPSELAEMFSIRELK